mmetsp:Transcript_53208/g.116105  ORF Transcript_53208/g.116105 Transcript_53208/m.116105 type:complete len:268 (-) Transcript_53208:240-1043(-)
MLLLSLEFRFFVLQLGFDGGDLLGELVVLIFEPLPFLRPRLVPRRRALLHLLLDGRVATPELRDGLGNLGQGLLHFLQLMVLILKTVLELHILIGHTKAVQPLNLIVVGDPEHIIRPLFLQLFQRRSDLFTQQLVDLIDLVLLLFQGLQSNCLLVLIHASAGGLFDHTQRLLRLHVDHLRNPTLHDEKMGVVHIQRHRMKQILNLILLHVVRVQEIPVSASDDDLTRNDDLVVHLVPHRTVLLVLVVEDNGHTGFRHAGLPLLVYKL